MRLIDLAPHVAFASLTALLLACSGGDTNNRTPSTATPPERSAEEQRLKERADEVRRERDAFVAELQQVRADIDRRLAEVNKDLENSKLAKEVRKEKEDWRDNLTRQRKDVDQALDDVQGSTDDTWDDVKVRARKTADDVGDWFKKQAEKIDQKTGSDADNDGH